MTAINQSTASTAGAAAAANPSSKPLGQADFLLLMTKQMQNQDPLKPMDSTDMLSQLAQFSTVQGIDSLNSAMGAMASVMESDQTLRAAQLVGREAYVETDRFNHQGGVLKGEVVAARPGAIQVDILDASGNRVARRTVQADTAGPQGFQWDGKDDTGKTVAHGQYTVAAATDAGANATALDIRLASHVESVSIEDYALVLNLPGLGQFSMAQVRRLG